MTTAEKWRKEVILLEKKDVLVRLLSRKFGITEEKKNVIKSVGVNDPAMLDRALDRILFSDAKEVVLRALGD